MEVDSKKPKSLKNIADLKPCYLFVSKSNSILEERIEALKRLLKNQINMDTDFKIFYGGEEINEQELSNFYNTPSFFSLRKVAVIKNFDKADASLSGTVLELLKKAGSGSLGTILIITASRMIASLKEKENGGPGKVTSRKSKGKTSSELLQLISAIGKIETLNVPFSDSLKKWLYGKSELDGLNFTQKAAARFVENVNFDFNLLKKEYEKIYTYMISEKEKTVDEDTVNKLVSRVFEMKIFDLVDFIGKRDKNNALVALKSVVEEKKSVKSLQASSQSEKNLLGLLTLLHRMFKAFLYIKSPSKDESLKSYVERNIGHIPYMVGRVSSNYSRFSKNFSSAEIIKIFGILNEYDILLRTSYTNSSTGLVLKLISDITDVRV